MPNNTRNGQVNNSNIICIIMNWTGRWKNQYGSVIEITFQQDNKVEGKFYTALKDSAFYEKEIDMVGVCTGEGMSLTGGAATEKGTVLVSYTGLFCNGKYETMWFFVADTVAGNDGQLVRADWWKAVTTNADTFTREA